MQSGSFDIIKQCATTVREKPRVCVYARIKFGTMREMLNVALKRLFELRGRGFESHLARPRRWDLSLSMPSSTQVTFGERNASSKELQRFSDDFLGYQILLEIS